MPSIKSDFVSSLHSHSYLQNQKLEAPEGNGLSEVTPAESAAQ